MSQVQLYIFVMLTNKQDVELLLANLKEEAPRAEILLFLTEDLNIPNEKLASLAQRVQAKDLSWAANQKAAAILTSVKDAKDALLLLWDGSFKPRPGAIKKLCTYLLNHPEVPCVSPLELRSERLDPGKFRVLNLGLAVAPDHTLLALYEGLPASHPLVHKDRTFQLGLANVLLLRLKDFYERGGFTTNLDQDFLGLDLTLKLATAYKTGLRTLTCAAVTTNEIFKTLARLALWNSQMERGRLFENLVTPDLEELTAQDGLSLNLDKWLNLYPVLADSPQTVDLEELWRLFRTAPNPNNFLNYFVNAQEDEQIKIKKLIENYPSNLPHHLAWY
ncbi:MAG: hypothetical protein IJS50_04775, partial [Desulfovibrio sp.]|nr:hypothetical protein [Desulfovibrio sp.]